MSEPPREARSAIVSKLSPHSVSETVRVLTDLLKEKGLRIFSVIDQREEARRVGLELRETTVVEFGNPAAGTPIMDAAPLVALDLPLKVLIWAGDGVTQISYYPPAAIALRHGLNADLLAPLAAIDALTDVIASS